MNSSPLSLLLIPAILAAGGPRPPLAHADSTDLLGLPLIELPVNSGHGMLALLLTGDGGWARGDQSMAAAFRARSIPVIGFVSPSYLQVPRTPDLAGEDLRRVLDHYLREWHAERVIVVGYSRGADLLPFMVSRLPAELRRRLALVAMVGLSDQASFQYRPTDIFADGLRFTDRPVELKCRSCEGCGWSASRASERVAHSVLDWIPHSFGSRATPAVIE